MYIDTVDVNKMAVLISVRSRSCFCIGIGPLKTHIKQRFWLQCSIKQEWSCKALLQLFSVKASALS